MASSKVNFKEDFILEWEKQVCLWNVFHPSYNNRDDMGAAQNGLASKFRISGEVGHLVYIICAALKGMFFPTVFWDW